MRLQCRPMRHFDTKGEFCNKSYFNVVSVEQCKTAKPSQGSLLGLLYGCPKLRYGSCPLIRFLSVCPVPASNSKKA